MTERDNDKLLEQMSLEDEQLISQFFEAHRLDEIADDGFSERVMSSLPDNQLARLSKLWTAICVVIGVLGFMAFHGWNMLHDFFMQFYCSYLQYFPMVASAYVKALFSWNVLYSVLAAGAVLFAVWLYNEIVDDSHLLIPTRKDV